jgi:hypothetical protein
MPTQAVYYRDLDGVQPVVDVLDREFPLEPRKRGRARLSFKLRRPSE